MAADYWQSTQHLHWETPKASLDDLTTPENEEDKALIALYPLPESRFLNIYLQQRTLTPVTYSTHYNIGSVC